MNDFRLLQAPLLLLFTLGIVACASQPEQPVFQTPEKVDLSGHWEKNYQSSDDVNNKFRLFIADIQRSIARSNNSIQGRPIPVNATGMSNESINGLARLTEDITKVALLEVTQDDNSISIDREDNFALTCNYFDERFVISENPFGSEACGWNGEKLIFQYIMADGLSIIHQVTLGPNQQQLNITTTVSSRAVTDPFTVSNFFQRYTPPEYDFDCIFTITRENVCTQNGS